MRGVTRYIVIGITAAFVLLTVIKSFYLVHKYSAVDLRTRIVASRLITTPYSPYYYKWKPADGEFYLDPVDKASRLVNGNVVTPATLAVLYPMSQLAYPKILLLWTILQLLAGFGIIYILFRQKKISETIVQSCLIVLGFICSDYWFYNIESGQVYIFYALLFAAMYKVYTSSWRYHEFLSGFIGGLFILFRPFAALIGLGFLLQGKKKWILGCITGFVAGVLFFAVPQIHHWQDYFSAMQEYVNEDLGHPHIILNTTEPLKPALIEGAGNLDQFMVFHLGRLDPVYHLFARWGIIMTYNQCLLLFGGVICILAGLFFRRKNASAYSLFLFGFLLYILAELFVPAPRQGYNVIQWIVPMSLIYLHNKLRWTVLIMLITSLLLLHNFPFTHSAQGKIAELFFLGILFYEIFIARGDVKEEQG